MNDIDKELFDAVIDGGVDKIKKAISKGANIEARNESGLTPMLYAIILDKPRAFLILLAFGANRHALTPDGLNAVILAVKYKRDRALETTTLVGIDINHCSKTAGTALHEAVRQNRAPSIRILLSRGINPRLKNSKGLTPWEMAITEKAAPSTIAALKKYGGETSEEIKQEGSGDKASLHRETLKTSI